MRRQAKILCRWLTGTQLVPVQTASLGTVQDCGASEGEKIWEEMTCCSCRCESIQRPRSEILGAEVQVPQRLDLSALLLVPQPQGPSKICPRQAAERRGACLQL